MIKLKNIMIGENIIRDAVTNRISIFNIFEDFSAVGFPIFIPKLGVYLLFQKDTIDEAEKEFNLKLYNNDEEIFSIHHTTNFGNKKRNRIVTIIQGVYIKAPERLRVVVEDKHVEIGSAEFDVFSINAEPISQSEYK